MAKDRPATAVVFVSNLDGCAILLELLLVLVLPVVRGFLLTGSTGWCTLRTLSRRRSCSCRSWRDTLPSRATSLGWAGRADRGTFFPKCFLNGGGGEARDAADDGVGLDLGFGFSLEIGGAFPSASASSRSSRSQ